MEFSESIVKGKYFASSKTTEMESPILSSDESKKNGGAGEPSPYSIIDVESPAIIVISLIKILLDTLYTFNFKL